MKQIGSPAFSGKHVQAVSHYASNRKTRKVYVYKTDAGDLTLAEIMAIAKSRGVTVSEQTIRQRLGRRYCSSLDYLFTPTKSGKRTEEQIKGAAKRNRRRAAAQKIAADRMEFLKKTRAAHKQFEDSGA